MNEIVLKQIAFLLIENINEINRLIKELEVDLRNKNNIKETRDKIRNIITKFNEIIESCHNNFILPEKMIDKILVLFIKFFDISFAYSNIVDMNIIAQSFIPLSSIGLPLSILTFILCSKTCF